MNISNFGILPISPNISVGHISSVWEHLQKENTNLTKTLKADEVISAEVCLFDGSVINVNSFGYAGPNLLTIRGFIGNKDVKVYVHQSCLQVVFSINKKDSNFSKSPIGFVNENQAENK